MKEIKNLKKPKWWPVIGHIEMLVDVWEGNPRPTPRLTVPPLRKGSLTSKFKPLVGLSVGFGSDREK